MKLADLYQARVSDREPFLRRGRKYAALTVPHICPPTGSNGHRDQDPRAQSYGAKLTKNLASKLLMSFLPPGGGAFTLGVPLKKLVESGTLSVPPDLARPLALCTKLANDKIETLRWRRPTFTSLLHLIITGNVCEHMQPDGRIKLYRLDQYVVSRDWSGQQLEVIVCEKQKVRALPQELRSKVKPGVKEDETVSLYSLFRDNLDGTYTVRQDLDDEIVTPETKYTGLIPVQALRWTEAPEEDYGRGHVEDHFDDLNSLEMHCGHMLEAGAAGSMHYVFVRPNAAGGNLRKRIEQARNGSIISANPDDVSGFNLDTSGAMNTTAAEIERISRSLAAAFLLTSDLRRDAERVTAFELRQLAQELESALGGVYSLLSSEMQAWRLNKLIAQMRSRGELPDFGDEDVTVTVTTGIEALGRDETLNKVQAAFQLLAQAGTIPPIVEDHIKFDELLSPGMTALGFAQAVRSSAEVDERVSQRQQAEMMQKVAQSMAGPAATAALSEPQ